jgi:hypothetical protein
MIVSVDRIPAEWSQGDSGPTRILLGISAPPDAVDAETDEPVGAFGAYARLTAAEALTVADLLQEYAAKVCSDPR